MPYNNWLLKEYQQGINSLNVMIPEELLEESKITYMTDEQKTDSVGQEFTLGRATYEKRDELFIDAASFVIVEERTSIGILQRCFNIGFNIVARILDQLEWYEVVGVEEGTKSRRVLPATHDMELFLRELL